MIAKIERAVLHGGLFAMAMPRGSGKTTLCQTCACVWADPLSGIAPFVCLIARRPSERRSTAGEHQDVARDQRAAAGGLSRGRLSDPKLDGSPTAQRASLQGRADADRLDGRQDRPADHPRQQGQRRGDHQRAGMKGSDIRGQNHARADGTIVRPSLVVIDDPQTDESAWSLIAEPAARGDPGRRRPGLGRARARRSPASCPARSSARRHGRQHPRPRQASRSGRASGPRWSTRSRPTRSSGPSTPRSAPRASRNDGDGREATEFYRQHREEMDAGAVVAWPERYNDDELSAIQHAMNLKLRDEAAFFAEYQNEPLLEEVGDGD